MIRQLQVVIGPLKDYQNTGTNNALKLTSSGADNDFRISFSVQKDLAALGSTTLTLTNLAPDTRKTLQTSQLAIALYGGYVGHPLSLIAKGGITSSTSARSGAEITTSVHAIDGYGAVIRAVFNKTYAGQVPLKQVVTELAQTFRGITLGEISLTAKLGNKGRVLSGATTEILDTLADNFGFSWSIHNGVFQAIEDASSSKRLFILGGEQLISIAPVLAGPNSTKQVLKGVTITALLDVRMQPGDRVRVESSINPDLNRDYVIQKCQLTGSSHSDQWTTKIESFIKQ